MKHGIHLIRLVRAIEALRRWQPRGWLGVVFVIVAALAFGVVLALRFEGHDIASTVERLRDVYCSIAECRGASANNAENGKIKVTLSAGTRVVVMTADGSYVERAKD